MLQLTSNDYNLPVKVKNSHEIVTIFLINLQRHINQTETSETLKLLKMFTSNGNN